jgi:hypothetical protein
MKVKVRVRHITILLQFDIHISLAEVLKGEKNNKKRGQGRGSHVIKSIPSLVV